MGRSDQSNRDPLETVLLLAGELAHTACHAESLDSAAKSCQCPGDRHGGQEHFVGVDPAILRCRFAEAYGTKLITERCLTDDKPYQNGRRNGNDDPPVGCGTTGKLRDKFRCKDAGTVCHIFTCLSAASSADG